MTDNRTEDIFARGAQWVPILAFHLGLYLQDPEVGWSVLEPGNPLFDAMPIDQIAAVFILFDSLCAIGDISTDDMETLMKEFGSSLTQSDDPGEGESAQ